MKLRHLSRILPCILLCPHVLLSKRAVAKRALSNVSNHEADQAAIQLSADGTTAVLEDVHPHGLLETDEIHDSNKQLEKKEGAWKNSLAGKGGCCCCAEDDMGGLVCCETQRRKSTVYCGNEDCADEHGAGGHPNEVWKTLGKSPLTNENIPVWLDDEHPDLRRLVRLKTGLFNINKWGACKISSEDNNVAWCEKIFAPDGHLESLSHRWHNRQDNGEYEENIGPKTKAELWVHKNPKTTHRGELRKYPDLKKIEEEIQQGAQDTKGVKLADGYSIGDKVVSKIVHGNVVKGDVGTIVGPCEDSSTQRCVDKERRVLVDFQTKNMRVNILTDQIRKQGNVCCHQTGYSNILMHKCRAPKKEVALDECKEQTDDDPAHDGE